jgi:hypothetical protein
VNFLNRLLIILLLFALTAGALAVVILAWTRPDESIAALRDAVDWLDENNETLQRIVLTSIGLLVALIAVSTLVFELMPNAGTDVKVTDVRAGDAVLSTASIGQRIDEAVQDVPHVADSRSVVKAKRKGVTVSLDLHVEPEANLAAVATDAADAVKGVLADKVHVALLEPPRIRLHYRELRLRTKQEQGAEAETASARESEPAAVGAERESPDAWSASEGPAEAEGVREERQEA